MSCPTSGPLKLADLKDDGTRVSFARCTVDHRVPHPKARCRSRLRNQDESGRRIDARQRSARRDEDAERRRSRLEHLQLGTSPHFAIDPVELQKKADELAEWALVISSADVKLQLDIPDLDGVNHAEQVAAVCFYTLTLGTCELMTALVVDSTVEIIDAYARINARPRFARKWVVPFNQRTEWRQNKVSSVCSPHSGLIDRRHRGCADAKSRPAR